ncbi:MAG: hypothetical protein P0S95_00600 [Rhabdochlamydiaceae bacterium]|nr:hypothetical protein [Candidatus Amphrikana amoebophyrae]
MSYKKILNFTIFCTISMTSMLFGNNPPATEFDYHFSADLMWMKRVKLGDASLLNYDGTFTSTGKIIGNETLVHGLDREFGTRLSLLMQPSQAMTMEGRAILPIQFVSDIVRESYEKTNVDIDLALGYGLNADDSNPLPTPVIDFQDSDYTVADKGHIHYQTTFWDVEANYWTHVTPPRVNYFSASYAFGLRYLNLQEIFRETLHKGLAASYFRVETRNNMYGGQVSARLEVNPYSFITWGIRGCAGLLGNNVARENHVTDHNGVTDLIKRSDHHFMHGYIGEAEFYVQGYFLRRFNWYLGFDGIWLRGAALAPDNINLTEKITLIFNQENIFLNSWAGGLALSF